MMEVAVNSYSTIKLSSNILQRVLLQDGSSFILHDELAQFFFAGCFTAINPTQRVC